MTLAAAVDRTGGAIATTDLPAAAALGALAALPIGVLVATRTGDWANPELRRLWGVADDAPLPRRSLWRGVDRLTPAKDRVAGASGRQRRTPLAAALAGETTPPALYRVPHLDGSSVVVRIATAPIVEDGELVGAILIATDETAQHDLQRLQEAFLGILGHELRTPVTSIVTGSYLVADDELQPEIRREVATTLADEAVRLQGLVDQLIELANLEQHGRVGGEPVALAHVVRRVIRDRRRKLPWLTIEAAVDGRVPPAAGHEGYIEQVLAILIDNAVKYSGQDGRIVVRVEDCGDEVEVHVLDEGPGLPSLDTEAVFRLFYRGTPERQGGQTGTGIGLFVARAIVEAMSGRIWAENRREGGADVGFALPVAER